ncbi:hypothetical protein PHLCEN_2v13440 [Hermanssonia centrifuga]|uniref:Uncharacterized protein n=1 Tax=Hermanssonia centrifuga TaxID=98765 RepID=A0A2R6NEA7_9APHY|nr:hypothetical protein PHLCEN_2v13440 [Hermanssonia centrifuga]
MISRFLLNLRQIGEENCGTPHLPTSNSLGPVNTGPIQTSVIGNLDEPLEHEQEDEEGSSLYTEAKGLIDLMMSGLPDFSHICVHRVTERLLGSVFVEYLTQAFLLYLILAWPFSIERTSVICLFSSLGT